MEQEKKTPYNVDVEIASAEGTSSVGSTRDHVVDPNDAGEGRVLKIRQGNSVLRGLRSAETWMDSKMKFEAMGVERIPEDKRKPPSILNVSAPFIVEPAWPLTVQLDR